CGIRKSPATPDTFKRFPYFMRFGKRIESQLPIVELIAAKIMNVNARNSKFSGVVSRNRMKLRISRAEENTNAMKVRTRFFPNRILRRSIGERIKVRIPPSSKANRFDDSPARIKNT